MSVRLPFPIVVLFLLAPVLVAPARAADFTVADLDDAAIHELVDGLIGFAEDYEADDTTGVVYLDRSHLIEARRTSYSIGHSSVLHAIASIDEDEATRVVRLDRGEEVVRAGAWVLGPDGALRRLDDADVRIDVAGEDGPAEVVFAFPRLQPGDTMGLSVLARADHRLGVRQLPIDADLPVAYGRFVLHTDGYVGYSVEAANVRRDDFSIEMGDEKNGNPSRVTCTYRALGPDRRDPLGLPWRARRAHVRVSFKGEFLKKQGIWLTWRHWNQIALAFEDEFRAMTEPTDEVRDRAQQVIASAGDAVSKEDALFRFVRDEIATLSMGESLEFVTAHEVLEDRAGDSFDKAGLLVALMRSQSIPARLGFARARPFGPLAHGNPGFWQFSDAVVFVGNPGDPDKAWYVPGTDGCPAGVLPPELRNTEVVYFVEDLEERGKELWRRALREDGGVEHRLLRKYVQLIRAADWTRVVRTGGDPAAPVGRVEETRVLDPQAGTARVRLSAHGMTSVANEVRAGARPRDVVEAYCRSRGFDPATVTAVGLDTRGPAEAVECTWDEEITGAVITPDTWILPPDLVFGKPFFDYWTGGDRGPVYVSSTRDRVLRTEIAIPAGWDVAETVHPVEVDTPVFGYRRVVRVQDGVLVVERTLRMKAGELGRASLPALDTDVAKVVGHETLDLVVRSPEAAASGDSSSR